MSPTEWNSVLFCRVSGWSSPFRLCYDRGRHPSSVQHWGGTGPGGPVGGSRAKPGPLFRPHSFRPQLNRPELAAFPQRPSRDGPSPPRARLPASPVGRGAQMLGEVSCPPPRGRPAPPAGPDQPRRGTQLFAGYVSEHAEEQSGFLGGWEGLRRRPGYKQCCDEHWGTCVSFPSGFLSVYAQQWDCWIIRHVYFQFFKESPHCSP